MSEVSPSIPGTSARESTCGSAHPRVSEPGLGRRDACAALAAQFPFDRAAVEVDLPWDAWGGDVLDAAKLCDVRTGLKAALLGPLKS